MPITVQTAAQNSWCLVLLAIAFQIDWVSGQIHVVRSLISDDPSVVNSLDIVRGVIDTDNTPIYSVSNRMAELLCTGLRFPAHLISRSTSSSRRRKWIKSMEVGGLRFT